jgi:hypothetical protein
MTDLEDGGRRYHSNGTEGDLWRSLWCMGCKHDHDFAHLPTSEGEGCPLMLSMVIEVDEPDLVDTLWYEQPDMHPPAHLVCLRFEPCEGDCDDPRAAPIREQYLALPRKVRD